MKASECKCCVCGKQAVAFWPVIDPDIPANPYCRECLDKAKMETFLRLFEHRTREEIEAFVKEFRYDENE